MPDVVAAPPRRGYPRARRAFHPHSPSPSFCEPSPLRRPPGRKHSQVCPQAVGAIIRYPLPLLLPLPAAASGAERDAPAPHAGGEASLVVPPLGNPGQFFGMSGRTLLIGCSSFACWDGVRADGVHPASRSTRSTARCARSAS